MPDATAHVTWLARQCANRGLKLAHGRALLDALWAADQLGRYGGNVKKAADAAGMDRGQFYRLIGRTTRPITSATSGGKHDGGAGMNGPERIWLHVEHEAPNYTKPPAEWLHPHKATGYVRDDMFAAENARADKAEALLAEAVEALRETERFMSYFSGETGGSFAGPGTPVTCLSKIRAILARAEPIPAAHPDDLAVDRFAAAMKAKMASARAKGRSGWDNPSLCSDAYLAHLLMGHIGKTNPGTFEDIANFCMMLHQRHADPSVLPSPDAYVAAENARADKAEALLAEAHAAGLREAAEIVTKKCQKCGGEDWLWGHELDDPPDVAGHDDTRYSCDGEPHKLADAILARAAGGGSHE